VETFWTDSNKVDFAIETWTVTYSQPSDLVIADWGSTECYKKTTLTLVFNLAHNFWNPDWLEFKIPMGLKDILEPSTKTLITGNNLILPIPEVWWTPKVGAET